MRKYWTTAILSVAILNLLDAALTIYGVNKGAQEVNPLMKYALENGFFLQVKMLASLVICLFYCAKVNSLPVKIVVLIVLAMYAFININHILLLKTL